MKTNELYTVGYEGWAIEEFVLHLKSYGIGRLIDVRKIPLSRKKGFSKSALKMRLESENIDYVHLGALGSPSDMRHKLKADHDYGNFFRAYDEYLSRHNDAIVEAYRHIQDILSCLMCFEKKSEMCHRIALANKIKECAGNGVKISHI
jgi:uncharacterized protein (DUF488 family)